MAKLKPHNVAWPPMFEPQHLLCGPPDAGDAPVVALTRRGFGAITSVRGSAHAAAASPFALDGVGEFGPLAGASWSKQGLELVTKAGKLLLCPGHAPTTQGVWACRASGEGVAALLPSGGQLLAAALAEPVHSSNGTVGARRLAMVHEES